MFSALSSLSGIIGLLKQGFAFLQDWARRNELKKARQDGVIEAQRDALLTEREALKKIEDAENAIKDIGGSEPNTLDRLRKHEF
jgi:hypothetical protein